MSLSDILTPRPEVLRKEGIDGVIDIENLRDRKQKSIESRPEDFFGLTYPTSDVKTILNHLHHRFNSGEKSAGLFLLEGLKGSGKSHLELLVYHLFKNPSAAAVWLNRHKLECLLPDDAIVSIHKFTDYPRESLWGLAFEELGAERGANQDKLPNLKELRDALSGKKLVLILDELEMGIQSIVDDHVRAQNLGFLQMLTEEASRSENASVTIFASVYDSNKEPGATLKRVPRIDVKFAEPLDRQMVVMHRLFTDALEIDPNKVDTIVTSYVNKWKKSGVAVDNTYLHRFVKTYPFTPELIDMLLHRVLRRDFQGNRGPLSLLAGVVRTAYKKVDVISASQLDVNDAGIRNILLDLDPGQTIFQCAQNDLHDLQILKYASEIVSAVLVATLTSSGNVVGLSEDQLVHQVVKPDDDYNEFTASLRAFDKMGSYFQQREGNYLFDTQEKPYAKVEYRALRVDASDARDFAINRWKINVFGDSNAVVVQDVDQVRAAINQLDKNRLRFVFAPRRLTDDERALLYYGAENQNQIILLEPKSDTFNALEHPDLIKWGQLAIAANDLTRTSPDSDRRHQYEKIYAENCKYIEEAFKKAALYYVSIHVPSSGEAQKQFELEPLGSAFSHTDVLAKLQQDIYPRQRFEDHISECLHDDRRKLLIDRTVSEIKATYRKTLGFPVFTAETILTQAITQLCKDKKIGLKNSRSSHCGSTPPYSGTEWNEVVVVEPFVEDAHSSSSVDFVESPHSENTANIGTAEAAVSIVTPQPDEMAVSIQTPNETSLSQLRLRAAERLAELDDPKIHRIKAVIYAHSEKAELGTFPSALRGTLSGLGELTVEITIEQQGLFNKAQVEQAVEQLPSYNEAHYHLELRGVAKAKVDAESNDAK